MHGTRFSIEVRPTIPEQLRRLSELAEDLLYSWDRGVRGLFFRLDPVLWESCGHNPKVFLRRVSQNILDAAVSDRVYLEDYTRVLTRYDNYLQEKIRPDIAEHLNPDTDLIAYFCAEFGFHESLPIYSGGLGILAGDHCKAASDLSVPFVAVGILYRQGFFTQSIDAHGNQLAHYTPTEFADLPIKPALDSDGTELHVNIHIEDRDVALKVWQVNAGHITVYLLDSDLEQNSAEDRAITYQLYGGDNTTRIQQELVLGIGGVRALRALGLSPSAWHINEGHASFMILERCREYVRDQGMDFASALERVAASTVFTTHTPVPAGHDIFDHELTISHFKNYVSEVGLGMEEFLQLGSSPENQGGFNQTALGLRGSRFHNGVSQIHGDVASEMMGYIWPQIPYDENALSYVTNGVHGPTFLAREWVNLFDMRFGREWRNELHNESYWDRIDEIPDHSYWSIRQSLKSDLLDDVRRRSAMQHRRNNCSDGQIARLTHYLMPHETDILVIGFARRFATYKRATLLFSDPARLSKLLNNPDRPVIIIFAGKAHPNDLPGQNLIRVIHEFSHKPEFEGKIILLENYDMALARRLVSGVDVWLNTPEYPMEASGTSGQKAGMNGVINLSVLDGWWGEGYNGENGWGIAPQSANYDPAFRDKAEGKELLDIIEHHVIPLYYDREGQGYSDEWVQMSKASMKSTLPQFNAQRMMVDYIRDYYAPATRQSRIFSADNGQRAVELAQWKQRVNQAWPGVGLRVTEEPSEFVDAGKSVRLAVAANLNGLAPDDVVVECQIGTQAENGEFVPDEHFPFTAGDNANEHETSFELALTPPMSGLQKFRIRMYPSNSLMGHPFEMGCMIWV